MCSFELKDQLEQQPRPPNKQAFLKQIRLVEYVVEYVVICVIQRGKNFFDT